MLITELRRPESHKKEKRVRQDFWVPDSLKKKKINKNWRSLDRASGMPWEMTKA